MGGSWGSTLSLAYAQRHPERVIDLVLRGIFLLRRAELDWFYQEGCSWLFPDAFEAYANGHPTRRAQQHDGGLLSPADPSRSQGAARSGARLERLGGTTLSLQQDPERIKLFSADTYAIAFARIECHYFVNRGFFARDDELLAGAGRIARTFPAPSCTAATTS